MKEFKLRAWRATDAKSLAQAANNPNIAKNLRNAFPNPYTLEDAICFIKDCISKGGKNQITYAIEVDGKAVGSIGIFVKDDIYEKSGELGYWLSEEYWCQGIVSRAVQMICKEAFESLILSAFLPSHLPTMQVREAFWKRQVFPMRALCAAAFTKMEKFIHTVCILFYGRKLRPERKRQI